jgi:hypothetical protein
MGQTDVASLLYADDECTIFTPMACKVDGLHPHLAQQMADARIYTKSKVMVFIPREGESCSVPAQDRLNTWTLGGIAMDQVSKPEY